MNYFLNKSVAKIVLMLLGVSEVCFGSVCQDIQEESKGVYVCEKIIVSEDDANIPEDAKFLKVNKEKQIAVVAECAGGKLEGVVKADNPDSNEQWFSFFRANLEISRIKKNGNFYKYSSAQDYGVVTTRTIEKDGSSWKVGAIVDKYYGALQYDFVDTNDECKSKTDRLCDGDALLLIDGKKVHGSFKDIYSLLVGNVGSIANIRVHRLLGNKKIVKEVSVKRVVAWEVDSMKTYYDNGTIERFLILRSPFSDSVTWEQQYYESGNLESVTPITRKYGSMLYPEGDEKCFYESGELKCIAPYIKGKLNGLYREFYKSGSLSKEVSYKNGMRDGFAKLYYENGTVNSEITFKNDKANGIEKIYYQSGKIYRTNFVKDGAWDGVSKVYFENGKLAGSGKFRNGELVGYFKCSDGRLGTEKINCLE